MKRVSPLVLILVGTFLWGSGMVMEHDSLALCLDFQRYQFPQEKIHVKTDKSQYMGGDTIWFRAFVVDACTHEPLRLSKYVYAELKTPFDSLLCRVMIKEVEGVYAGYMAIPPKVAEGDYTLTAYTLFMEGVGEQYFFKKSLPILSPFATQTVINPQFDWDNEKKEFKVEVSYKDKITGADKSYKEMTYSTRDGKSRIKRLGNKIPSVLKGDYDSPSSVVEIGQEVSGEVRSTWSNKPLRGASINILSPKVGFYNIVKSDSAGRFCFNGFDYPEGAKFVLQAFTAKNKEIMNLRVDELVFPNTSAIIGVTADAENTKEINEFLERELKRSQYDADLRSILLDELTVVGRKIKQSEDVFENLATKTFNYEEFEKMKITSVEEVLRKIPNIRINNGIITYRGNAIALYIDRVYQETMIEMIDMPITPKMYSGSSLSYSNSNAMPIPSVSTQNNVGVRFIDIDIIPFDMIKRIDFLRPNEAVVLGTKATGGGALMITTKRGNEGYKWTKPTNIVNITPLGYQRPAEFYSPRYEINEPSIGDDTRTTIYWNPNIKTDESGNSKIEFFTNDIRNTTYTIIIEGITPAGEIISEKYPLKIK